MCVRSSRLSGLKVIRKRRTVVVDAIKSGPASSIRDSINKPLRTALDAGPLLVFKEITKRRFKTGGEMGGVGLIDILEKV